MSELCVFQDEEETVQYGDVFKFLTANQLPRSASDYEVSCIQQLSKCLCVVDDGKSQYLAKMKEVADSSNATVLKIATTEDSRRSAIKQAHVDGKRS
jgi:hypothetical protein